MEWPETLLTSSSYAPTQNKRNCWMWNFLWPLPCHALFFEEFKVKLTALPACPEMLQLVHVECPVWFWARAGEHPPCNRSPESIQRHCDLGKPKTTFMFERIGSQNSQNSATQAPKPAWNMNMKAINKIPEQKASLFLVPGLYMPFIELTVFYCMVN